MIKTFLAYVHKPSFWRYLGWSDPMEGTRSPKQRYLQFSQTLYKLNDGVYTDKDYEQIRITVEPIYKNIDKIIPKEEKDKYSAEEIEDVTNEVKYLIDRYGSYETALKVIEDILKNTNNYYPFYKGVEKRLIYIIKNINKKEN